LKEANDKIGKMQYTTNIGKHINIQIESRIVV